jgi:Uma2 family endonuclease
MVLDLTRSPVIPEPTITWDALPDDFVLPDDPVENSQQPALAAALTDALGAAGLIQPDMLITPNFGLVATVNRRTVVKAPDWLMVPRVKPIVGTVRRSYTPQLQGDPVAIVMEFLSDDELGELSVRATYPYGKLYFYERILQVPTYVTFDPYDVTLEVRQLQANGRYQQQQPNAQGHFWIPELNLFLGVWAGERLSSESNWLRWWDAQGQLLPWAAEQVEQERQRADVAEQQVTQAQQQVTQAQQQVTQAQQQAEQERQRADVSAQKAAALAAKLRELGIDPESL